MVTFCHLRRYRLCYDLALKLHLEHHIQEKTENQAGVIGLKINIDKQQYW